MNRGLLAVLLVLTMGTAGATIITLDLTAGHGSVTGNSAVGNIWTFTGGGVTAKVTSWSTTGSAGALDKAWTGQYGSYGLGVCNAAEGGPNCSSSNNMHTMDNYGNTDFLLFQFNVPVDPIQVQLQAFGTGDSDLTYWVGNIGSSTTLLQGVLPGNLGSLGFGGPQLNADNTSTNPRWATLTSGYVNGLLIAAAIPDPDCCADYMKVKALQVDANPVPEPATMSLLGIALAGLGLLRLRKR